MRLHYLLWWAYHPILKKGTLIGGQQMKWFKKLSIGNKIAFLSLLVSIIGVFIAVLMVPKDQSKSVNEKITSFVRFKYIICTGPYNISESALKFKQNNYLLKDKIFHFLNENGAFNDNKMGVVSFITLYGSEIDKYFGLNIDKEHISAAEKAEKYRAYFNNLSVDTNLIYQIGLLPQFIASIKAANPDYNEPINYEISEASHDNSTAQLHLLFRSIRVKSLLIENISDKPIKQIVLHAKEYTPRNLKEIRIGSQRLLKDYDWQEKLIQFPIDFLKPNESIILPLDVELVSEQYASGYIYESNRDKSRIDVLSNGFPIHNNENAGTYKAQGVQKDHTPEPIDVGSALEVKSVQFIVDGEKKLREYSREFDKDNLIYVNDTCECGSCPVLLGQNNNGAWRRLREMISNNKEAKNVGTFSYKVPSSAIKFKIEEFKGETSYFSEIGLVIINSNGTFYEEMIKSNKKKSGIAIVTYGNPYIVDLSKIHRKYDPISEISIIGSGYYTTKSKTICPPVPVLNPELF